MEHIKRLSVVGAGVGRTDIGLIEPSRCLASGSHSDAGTERRSGQQRRMDLADCV